MGSFFLLFYYNHIIINYSNSQEQLFLQMILIKYLLPLFIKLLLEFLSCLTRVFIIL